MKRIINTMLFYAFFGLALGVAYREFTKMNGFTGKTMLSQTHVHTLALGTFFFLIILVLDKLFDINKNKRFGIWYWCYNAALLGVIATMVVRGMLDVYGMDNSMLPHIAGTFHTFYGVCLIWFMFILKKAVLPKQK